jgi:hypothetical protein
MPKEPTIVAQKVVIPTSREVNQYGDLIFFDGNGTQHKIGNKRPQVFESIVIGKAVELYYAQYMERQYICGAKLVEGQLPEAQEPQILPEHKAEIDRAVEASHSDMPPVAPQAIGMTTKEIGDMIRASIKDKDSYGAYLIAVFGQDKAKQIVAWYQEQILKNTSLL